MREVNAISLFFDVFYTPRLDARRTGYVADCTVSTESIRQLVKGDSEDNVWFMQLMLLDNLVIQNEEHEISSTSSSIRLASASTSQLPYPRFWLALSMHHKGFADDLS